MSPTTTKTNAQTLVFIDNTPSTIRRGEAERQARRKIVRSHATRVSTSARLATYRSRVEGWSRPPGQGVFQAVLQTEPSPSRNSRSSSTTTTTTSTPRQLSLASTPTLPTRDTDSEAAIALHARNLLGGPIPAAQANVAILAQFLHRFAAAKSPTDRPWVTLVLSEATSSSTPSPVTMALHANASALCANDLNDPDLRRHAINLYQASISRLQKALKGPNWHDPVVMYTCMIMTLFETIVNRDPSASFAHVGGVALLIRQKGPLSFIHGLEHQTFRYYRINIVMMCLTERKHCFLAEPEWRDIPFSGDTPPKTILDCLLDILAEIPGVLSTVEELCKGGLSQWTMARKAFDLVCWVRRLISDFEVWKHDCIFTHPKICITSNPQKLSLLALCELGTEESSYDPRLGEALNCYAASHLILTRIAQRFGERSYLVSFALRPTYTLRELVAAIVLVSKRHISIGTADMISVMVTTFPLKVAHGVTELPEEPEMFENVRELLQQINERVARKYNVRHTVASDDDQYKL